MKHCFFIQVTTFCFEQQLYTGCFSNGCFLAFRGSICTRGDNHSVLIISVGLIVVRHMIFQQRMFFGILGLFDFAVKAHYAPKMISWKSSWCARVCASILDINEIFWSLKLYEQLQLPPLTTTIIEKLKEIDLNKWELRRTRHSEQYKQSKE